MKTINDYADLVKEQHTLNTTIAPVETDLTSASKAYAVGQKFIYDGVLYQAKTAIAQGAALVLNTNYEAADDVSSEIEALEKELEDEAATRSTLGAKNILPFDLDDIKALNTNGTWAGNVYTYRDVDFTVNADGTVTVNGTATGGNASIKLYNASANYEMLGKKVILNGCPSGGSATTYRIQAYRMGSADGSTGTYFDDGEGTIAFDALNNASGTVGSFAVAVYENATVTNLLFKPMVRLASDPDATYQQYAKTNRELTAENQTLTNNLSDEVETRAKLGAHNITPYPYYTQTPTTLATSLAVSEPEKGVIRFNGTAVGAAVFYCGTDVKLPAGEYEVSKGVDNNSVCVLVEAYNGNTWVKLLVPEDYTVASSTFTLDYSNYDNLRITVRVRSDATLSNVDVKPMIKLTSDKDNTWQPPVMTNRELTESVNGLKMKHIIKQITLTANDTTILDLSNDFALPSGSVIQSLQLALSVDNAMNSSSLPLPYCDLSTGDVKTWIERFNPDGSNVKITNLTSAWTNYYLHAVAFYT